MLISFLPFIAPAFMLLAAVFAIGAKGVRPTWFIGLAQGVAFGALLVALTSFAALMINGPQTSALIGANGFGLSVRLDALSVIMMALVSFIGWIVLRYAGTYLDGEPRQGAFTGWMLATLAAVLVLVQAGNVWMFVAAWIATSFFLHRLLVFYPERQAAQRAAHKKFVTARIADIALLVAAIILVNAYGTSDIASILAAARAGQSPDLPGVSASLLAVDLLLSILML